MVITQKFDLRPLLQPKSIAMVGASEKNFFSMMIFENLRKQGYEGKVFPINPKYTELAGHTCYPSLEELPEVPDTVIIMTRRDLVLGFVQNAISIGARSATIVSAGFSETGDPKWKQVEEEIREVAYEHNFPICGPNCLGIFSVREHVATMAAPIRGGAIPGNVGLVMQSGGMMLGLTYPFYQRRIGLSYAISTGNSLVLDCSDYIDFLVDDPNTKVICTFIEGIRKPERFVAVAKKALKVRKPIIALKTGASERGTRSTMAHTSSVAGNDDVINAIFNKYGIIRANDFDELLEAASLFSKAVEIGKLPKATGMCIISASGGSVGLLSDLSDKLNVPVPELTAKTQDELGELFPAGAFVCNPIDATGQILNDLPAYRKALEIIKEDPQIGMVISFETVGFPGNDTVTHQRRLLNTVEMCKELDIPLVSCSLSTHALDEWQCNFLMEEKAISLVQGAGKVLRVVNFLLQYAEFLRNYKEEGAYKADEARKRKASSILRAAKSKALTKAESKDLLAAYGLTIEAAGMIGIEICVRGLDDAQFGSVTAMGLGGTYMAVTKDTVMAAGPVIKKQALDMIKNTKANAVLGEKDINALAGIVVTVSELVYELKDQISMLELDPVIVLDNGKGAKITNAVITLK